MRESGRMESFLFYLFYIEFLTFVIFEYISQSGD